jgi:homocysteine S-methyltransferase
VTGIFATGPVILDGGLATELERRGHDISGPLWSAKLLRTNPEAVEQLHYDFFEAGADIATSASYQASYEGFAAAGIAADETTELLRRSVGLAQSARDRFLRDHPGRSRRLLVAASVGPYGAISHDGAEYRGDYGLSVGQLIEFHARRFGVLSDSGADLLACETIPTLEEARALVELLSRHPSARAWLSFTSHDGIHAAHGETLADCARLADGTRGVIAVGVNCVRPEIVGDAMRELRSGTGKPIVVYPNSGESWDATDGWRGSRSPSGLETLAPGWIAAGAAMVGGCCRVGPEQIESLRKAAAGPADAAPTGSR